MIGPGIVFKTPGRARRPPLAFASLAFKTRFTAKAGFIAKTGLVAITGFIAKAWLERPLAGSPLAGCPLTSSPLAMGRALAARRIAARTIATLPRRAVAERAFFAKARFIPKAGFIAKGALFPKIGPCPFFALPAWGAGGGWRAFAPVALKTRFAAKTGLVPKARLFAKTGLIAKAGATFASTLARARMGGAFIGRARFARTEFWLIVISHGEMSLSRFGRV